MSPTATCLYPIFTCSPALPPPYVMAAGNALVLIRLALGAFRVFRAPNNGPTSNLRGINCGNRTAGSVFQAGLGNPGTPIAFGLCALIQNVPVLANNNPSWGLNDFIMIETWHSNALLLVILVETNAAIAQEPSRPTPLTAMAARGAHVCE